MGEISEGKDLHEIPEMGEDGYRDIRPEDETDPQDSRQYLDNLFKQEIETKYEVPENPHHEDIDGKRYYYDDNGLIYRVDNELAANQEYSVNGYDYETDEQSRSVSASGKTVKELPKNVVKAAGSEGVKKMADDIDPSVSDAIQVGRVIHSSAKTSSAVGRKALENSGEAFKNSPEVGEISNIRHEDDTISSISAKFSELSDKANRQGVNLFENKNLPRTPDNNGRWSGDRGNSLWKPEKGYTPPEKSVNIDKPYSNPNNLAWEQILEKYGIEGIPFNEGFPDFSEIARGSVEIEGFETGGSVAKSRNFKKADIAMANQKGCNPEEVKKWREDNNYTWHECEDRVTMQKVPNEVHANIPHDGGRCQKE